MDHRFRLQSDPVLSAIPKSGGLFAGNAADKGSSQAGNAGTGSDVGDGGAAGAKGCYVESDLTTPSGLKKLTNLKLLITPPPP